MDDLIEKENQQFNRQARYENEEQFPVVICTFLWFSRCAFIEDELSLAWKRKIFRYDDEAAITYGRLLCGKIHFFQNFNFTLFEMKKKRWNFSSLNESLADA